MNYEALVRLLLKVDLAEEEACGVEAELVLGVLDEGERDALDALARQARWN